MKKTNCRGWVQARKTGTKRGRKKIEDEEKRKERKKMMRRGWLLTQRVGLIPRVGLTQL